MIKRTLYFGNPVCLNKKNTQLKITDPETLSEKARIPAQDIAILLAVNYQITNPLALIKSRFHRGLTKSCMTMHINRGFTRG